MGREKLIFLGKQKQRLSSDSLQNFWEFQLQELTTVTEPKTQKRYITKQNLIHDMTVKVNLFLGKKYFKIENLKNKERKFSSYLLKIYKNKVVINPSAVEKKIT